MSTGRRLPVVCTAWWDDVTAIRAHRAAIVRGDLSRPVRLAIETGLLADGDTVFDYGCGHGEDVTGLRKAGWDASGWDPFFRPDSPRRSADVVNLGYVVNVIAEPAERAEALRQAWQLTSKALIIAARLNDEARSIPTGRRHGDGYLTGNHTFQRFFSQSELRAWIDTTLEVESVAVAPGVFVVFRREEAANAFLVQTRRRRTVRVSVSRVDRLYNEHAHVLEPLLGFFRARGRLPRPGEADDVVEPVKASVRSVARAWRIVQAAVGDDFDWDSISDARRDDLLVDLALLRLNRRPNFTKLPDETQHDVKAFFGSYKDAIAAADKLLFSAGHLDLVERFADEADVGKRLPGSLYVHDSALPLLPSILRVYEGCARWLVGDIADVTLVKLATDQPRVSYLSYPEFDIDPHPNLHRSTVVRVGRLDVAVRDYTASRNPPILHRKESFVASEYPLRGKFARLTAQEERFGLYDTDTRAIGTRAGWDARLRERGVQLRGHRIVRTT
jgi:DNA phosphorothioation-associated putative methyltransferase